MTREIQHLLKLHIAGKTHDDLLKAVERLEEERKKGFESENRVRTLLSSAPYVIRCAITERGSSADRKGIDIEVKLAKFPYVSDVAIQVKSSISGILSEKNKIRDNFELAENEVEEWLFLKRRILLNGQDSEAEIVERFLNQVQAISEYYRALDPALKKKKGPLDTINGDYMSTLARYIQLIKYTTLKKTGAPYRDETDSGYRMTILALRSDNALFIEQGEGADRVQALQDGAKRMLSMLTGKIY